MKERHWISGSIFFSILLHCMLLKQLETDYSYRLNRKAALRFHLLSRQRKRRKKTTLICLACQKSTYPSTFSCQLRQLRKMLARSLSLLISLQIGSTCWGLYRLSISTKQGARFFWLAIARVRAGKSQNNYNAYHSRSDILELLQPYLRMIHCGMLILRWVVVRFSKSAQQFHLRLPILQSQRGLCRCR